MNRVFSDLSVSSTTPRGFLIADEGGTVRCRRLANLPDMNISILKKKYFTSRVNCCDGGVRLKPLRGGGSEAAMISESSATSGCVFVMNVHQSISRRAEHEFNSSAAPLCPENIIKSCIRIHKPTGSAKK